MVVPSGGIAHPFTRGADMVQTAQAGPPVTPQEAARRSERATLMLARSRAMADLQQACAAAHRAMLESAIADLDARIAAMDDI